MTYAEAVARLLALRGGEHTGMRPGLERIEALLAAVGHPEERFALIQIAGTNGKGSVSAMLATMLKAAGRRVGLYTSPHLVSFRERIRVNGEAIAPDAVADGVDALGTLIARLDATMFEATTALALDHFAREDVEVAVLEVGLGGRADSTTVGAPRVTIVTSIDLDHQAWLGDTLEEIAAEKAAIIRPGVEVAIAAAQAPEVAGVLARRGAEVGVPLLVEGRDLRVTVRDRRLAGQHLDCAGPGWRVDDLVVPMLGSFQPGNAVLAVAAAQTLDVSEGAIRAGLDRVRWPGRFQVIGDGPWLVLDGAHNPAGARALSRTLGEVFGERPVTLIVGIFKDKDAAAMLAALAPASHRLILTRFGSARASEPEHLAARLPAGTGGVELAGSLVEALARAEQPTRDPVVCVAGSLALVGETLRHLAGGDDSPCPMEKAAASMGRLS